ncbi:hypothetical protein [Bdellovibrio sp. HCB274]|uniref:hypothetical protein n=1 Tax=Bdellovibrio sp. HCB274 TaxID=3394361 RepID=UPI0039B503C3
MFKNILTFICASISVVGAVHAADAVGFSSGSQFQATPIEGQVHVTCEGFNGGGAATFTCRDVVLDPVSYDYFMGPRDARAVRYELRNLREDGSVRTKEDDYSGSQGRSGSAINLWISTIFQKPLLAAGKNKISYAVYASNNREPLSHGEFSINVARNASRVCPSTHYNSADVNDCSSQYSVCQRYFQQFNNCR